jgi:AAT family amino acid transporter
VPFYPYVTWFGITAQVASLALMVWSDALRVPLLIGLPVLFVPIVWYKLRRAGTLTDVR